MKIETHILERPDWLKIRIDPKAGHDFVSKSLKSKRLNTVCESASCPNLHECWSKRKTATFMILGKVCTRLCRFCAVKKGKPSAPDPQEPERIAMSAQQMQLRHVVITAVSRDDLDDGGAKIFADTVLAVRERISGCTVEVFPSDMGGTAKNLKILLSSRPDILNHNVETVPRLSKKVRFRASYARSLEMLRRAKEILPVVITKSGLMLGFGETKDEIIAVMVDLLSNNVDILTIGQYLPPNIRDPFYAKVEKYWHPDEFADLKQIALNKGFAHCEAGPLVRSSYHAEHGYTRIKETRMDTDQGNTD